MWLLVPSASFPPQPVGVDSIGASNALWSRLEQSATLKTKSRPARSWYTAWKQAAWMRRLFGRMPTPSTAAPGVERWMASLGATPASPSASQAADAVPTIPATSGPTGSGSSASLALTRSLGSRLQARLASCGSTLYRLTWKERTTPSGRSISALRGSGHRTSGSGSGSWPTPRAGESKGGEYRDSEKAITRFLDPKRNNDLNEAVFLASWPTPKQTDSDKGVRTMRGAEKELERKGPGADLPTLAAAASWGTPRSVETGHSTGSPERADQHKSRLEDQIFLAPWMTPVVPNYQARHGLTATGSPAETGKPGQLNPAFSLWLMGYPAAWVSCGARAMQLCRKSRRRL
ncbi:hypothetical protein LCGC14_2866900 [marine sediment metagenome]|uniref:Uncharacterized protein n=1 Tax=marine sediment metagenome TaxID=412755 RepID=A0A0F8Y3W7_9ZZZZ